MQISWSIFCCTILQAAYYVDILVVNLLHNIVGSVLCRYLGHYFAAQYCRHCNRQISWSLLYCTILQATYYIDIFVIALLHNIVGSKLYRYLGHYFAAQYCRLRTMQILGHYFAAQYCRQRKMQISCSLLCCTIMQAAYYVDILFNTLLHNIVGSVLCSYVGRYFVAQYCRQRSMQITWSLLCCTILQAEYFVDILVITLLHNTVGSVLCRYLCHYFATQYCRPLTMQICWTLLCCTILQTVYYVVILVIALLHKNVGSILFRYLDQYFAAQYCRQRTKQISSSLLYCTILQTVYYVDILVITFLHNIVGSVLCRYFGHYFSAQYCCTILQAAYYLHILVITFLHNIVGRVLCRYLSHYFAAQYCRQRTMQISWSILCCTILQIVYYVDNLVIALLHKNVGRVLCRYLVFFLLYNTVVSVKCRYLGDYFSAQYCRQRSIYISWSLLCCTILQQLTMQLSWSLLCCTILQTVFYVDI